MREQHMLVNGPLLPDGRAVFVIVPCFKEGEVLRRTVANPFDWRSAWKTGDLEARPAIQIIHNISPEKPPPLFVQSSLTESPFLNWKDGPADLTFSTSW